MFGDFRGVAGNSGEKQHDMAEKFLFAGMGKDHGLDGEGAILLKVDAVETAIGRPNLILGPDIFADHLLLDPDCLAGKFAFAPHSPFEGMEGMQQPHRKGRTGAQARSGRQIAIVMDVHARRDVHFREDGPDRRMVNPLGVFRSLDAGVDDPVLVVEHRWQIPNADITVFVNGHAEDGTAMFQIPLGIIRASAKQ